LLKNTVPENKAVFNIIALFEISIPKKSGKTNHMNINIKVEDTGIVIALNTVKPSTTDNK